MMVTVSIDPEVSALCPALALGCIECAVDVQDSSDELWEEFSETIQEWREKLAVEELSSMPAIKATRDAYRAFGKDPARYRPSAEALIRRALQTKDLYRVNNAVDTLNLISLRTGISIGGYDVSKIKGEVTLGIGEAGEPYPSIGKGMLNIEGLPVFRDVEGAFGNPTNDSSRTMVTGSTSRFLLILLSFEGPAPLRSAMPLATRLLKRFAWARDFEEKSVAANG